MKNTVHSFCILKILGKRPLISLSLFLPGTAPKNCFQYFVRKRLTVVDDSEAFFTKESVNGHWCSLTVTYFKAFPILMPINAFFSNTIFNLVDLFVLCWEKFQRHFVKASIIRKRHDRRTASSSVLGLLSRNLIFACNFRHNVINWNWHW